MALCTDSSYLSMYNKIKDFLQVGHNFPNFLLWKKPLPPDFNFKKNKTPPLGSPAGPAEAPVPLLNWDVVHKKMPWNVLLLLGGGFAMAHGSEVRQFIRSKFSTRTIYKGWDSDVFFSTLHLYLVKKSGLSMWLGESLVPLQSIPPYAICILLSLLVAVVTECSSNTATTTLFLPVVASMVSGSTTLYKISLLHRSRQ